jgi:hypothetical protein
MSGERVGDVPFTGAGYWDPALLWDTETTANGSSDNIVLGED